MAGTRLGYLTRVLRHGPQKQPAPRPGVLVHGTVNGYNGHGCRCDDCRKANAASKREYRHRPKTWPLWAHGRNTTYIDGCRCLKCRRAHTAYRAAWVARHRKLREIPTDRRRAARLEYFRNRYQSKKERAR